MKPFAYLLFLCVISLLAACTYGIKLDAGGEGVRTAWNGNVSECRDIGKVTVSVLSRVGPVDRNDIKVRDELEVMARNQAAEMHADTIVPLGEPQDGEQAWEGYACGNANAAPDETSPPLPRRHGQPSPFEPAPTGGAAQTYPATSSSGG